MRDNDYERPEKETLEELPVFSDEDLDEYLAIEEEPTKGEEEPKQGDPLPGALASLKGRRRSKRSLLLIGLLCVGLGILVLVVFFLMKPEVRRPQIVAKRMKRPIPSVEGGGKSAIPARAGEEAEGGKSMEGGTPRAEEPSLAKPAETLPMGREGTAERVVGTEGTVPPERKEGTEVGGRKPEIEGKGKLKPQVAKAGEPKPRVAPEGKMPAGRFTVNVASFRKKARADRLMNQLERKGYEAFVAKATIPKKGTWYRVSVGRFPSRKEARSFAQALKEKEGMASFVRELEGANR